MVDIIGLVAPFLFAVPSHSRAAHVVIMAATRAPPRPGRPGYHLHLRPCPHAVAQQPSSVGPLLPARTVRLTVVNRPPLMSCRQRQSRIVGPRLFRGPLVVESGCPAPVSPNLSEWTRHDDVVVHLQARRLADARFSSIWVKIAPTQ